MTPTDSTPTRRVVVAMDHLVLSLPPIRVATACCLVLAGLLVVAGTALVPGDGNTTRALHDALVEHGDRSRVADLLLHLAWIALALAAAGLVLLGSARRGALLVTGAVLAALGLTTLPGVFATDAFELALAQELPRAQSVAISEQAASDPLAAALFLRGSLGAALGVVLLLAALWRQGLVSWAAPLLAFAGPLLSVAGGRGAVAPIGAAVMAAGYAVAAWGIVRAGAPADEPVTPLPIPSR